MFTVREIQQSDIEHIIQYWLEADDAFLKGMGVDTGKMPTREQWQEMLAAQLSQPYTDKQSYCIIWEIDGLPVGHSNVNKIRFGEEAYMHLHLWKPVARQKGAGLAFVKLTLPFFFEHMQLKTLYCEPYALNPSPNKTLKKAGFRFVKSYVTIPGWLNFEQEVNLWTLDLEAFLEMNGGGHAD